ncbi:MAG: 23S rRNA (guanosine(2251)-2'-O)-methyltransferase RlmB [Acidimicrobiia bacterium]|nr:23S rRNA (guanosine(2251)-2'-O)-methyltransferase RlmB [Acidimicrobiia bacterium]
MSERPAGRRRRPRGRPRDTSTPAGFGEGPGGEQVEGRRAVRELLAAGRRPVRTVWLAEGSSPSPLLDEITGLARAAGVPVRFASAGRLEELARSAAPQGVVALAEPLRAVPLAELLARPDAFLVALDGVTDPQNLGAVARTAETAGASGLVLRRHRSARFTPAATKAAAGAIEHLPVAIVPGLPAALDEARRSGLWTVGLDADGPTSLFELPVADQPLVLVLGAEGAGLSRLVRDRCEVLARIPLWGALPSLNVSAAAALACFEVARRRHA